MINTNKVSVLQRVVRNRIKLARRSLSNGQPIRGIIIWGSDFFVPLDLSQVRGLKVGDKFTTCNNGKTWTLEIIETMSGYTALEIALIEN